MRTDGTDGTAGRTGADGIEEALLAFIAAEVTTGGEPPGPEQELVESGRVDSLGLLRILSFVEAEWRVDLLAAGHPQDLRTARALARAVRRAVAARQPAPEDA